MNHEPKIEIHMFYNRARKLGSYDINLTA